jgi:putative PIN family toxin of toxin-antitoxin system
MRVVLDTNVVMSRFLSPSGIPAKLVNQWLKEQPFTLVVTEEILHEYASVLLYPPYPETPPVPLLTHRAIYHPHTAAKSPCLFP